MVAAGCGLHYSVSARFGSFLSLQMLVQPKDLNVFHSYENPYNGAYSKETKQFYTMPI